LDRSFVVVPIAGFAQAVRGIIQNGLDASPADSDVDVGLRQVKNQWQLTVTDRGSGMSRDVLKRVSEPFFTTKPPGKGMGLGVFLTRGLVRRLGGDLQFQSDPDRGTQAIIELPVAATD
jgi:two-component system sensor histidine kinase RegB